MPRYHLPIKFLAIFKNTPTCKMFAEGLNEISKKISFEDMERLDMTGVFAYLASFACSCVQVKEAYRAWRASVAVSPPWLTMRAFLAPYLEKSCYPQTVFGVLGGFWVVLEADGKVEDFLEGQQKAYLDASRHLKGMDFLPPFASLQLNCKKSFRYLI